MPRTMLTGDIALGLVVTAAVVKPTTASLVYLAAVLLWLHVGRAPVAQTFGTAMQGAIGAIVPRVAGALLVPPVALLADDSASIARQALSLAVVCVAWRLLLGWLASRARARGWLRDRALIVGRGRVADDLQNALSSHPEYGLVSVGFVSPSGHDDGEAVLGGLDELDALIRYHRVRHVFVAFGPSRDAEVARAILPLKHRHAVEVYVVPRFFESGTHGIPLGLNEVWGIPLIRLSDPPHRSGAWRLKRAFDVTFAVTGLVLLSPLLAVIAGLVAGTSRGGVLFRQQRVGLRGRVFDVLKYRTMLVNEDGDTTWNVAEDDRLTLVGRFLRRASLDELPQLWNILRGEMSVVGPRPERPHFVEAFAQEIANYDYRHEVPVGLTGWAQVNGLRGDTSIEERVRFDNRYVEHWSFVTDLRIVLRTFREALHGR